MSDLPDSWETRALGDVNQFSSSTLNPATRPEELFELYSVPSFPTGVPERLLGSAIGSTKQTVETGDVLISKINPRINRVWTVGPKKSEVQIASSEWIGFRSTVVQPAFANYYFKSPDFREVLCSEVAGVGGSLTRAQPKRVAGYPIPIAPAAEQTRIANQLDTLLTRIQSCNDRFDAMPALLKRFRQVVLMKAITGELTANWRRLNQQPSSLRPIALGEDIIEIPVGWHLKTVQDIIDPDRPLCYGVVQPGEEQSGGVPLIRVQDLSNGTILGDQLRTVAAHIDQDFRRSRVKGGDLLISVVGTIGRAAIVPEDMTANIARAIARLSCKEGVLNKWAYFWFIADPLQWHLLSSSREVARKTLNLGDLALISIPIPPAQEQIEIVRRVDALFALADRLEAQANVARNHTQRLGPLVLAKAFRGELLPQDSQDESARVLLERLATQRAMPAAKKQPSRPRQVRATRAPKDVTTMSKSRQDDDVKGKPYLADHLRRLGSATTAEVLFKASELPIADFYKQLAWEVAQGHIADVGTTLEARHAAG